MTRATIVVGLLAALQLGTSGCAATSCDDLADAAAEGGCSTRQADQAESACEGEAEAYARCWLENVRDVCYPTGDELLAVDACRGG
jgi:hypothetical protein